MTGQIYPLEYGSAIDVSSVPAEVLLFPAGVVETTKYEPYLVDDEAAARCIGNFNAVGRDMVIDYEHATLKEQRFQGNAPAAGWLKSMRWEPGVGIFGRVEWTAQARQQIAAKQYRYISPVYFCDPKTGPGRKLLAAWQIALTNDPATIGAVPLVASRLEALNERRKGTPMEELAKVLGQSPDATPQQLAGAVTEANVAAAAAALGLSPSASIEDVRKAIMSKGNGPGTRAGEGGGGGPGQAPAGNGGEDATRQIKDLAKSLGLPEVASADALVAAHKAKFVDVNEHTRLGERLAALEKIEKERTFEAACNSPENVGKVHAGNREPLRKLYDADKGAFDALLKTITPAVSGTSVFEPEAASGAGTSREKVIAKARGAHKAEIASGRTVVCTEEAWVNLALRDAKLDPLTQAEVASNGIAAG